MDLRSEGKDAEYENLWSVLFTTGYLTVKEKREDGKPELIIPNCEIRELSVRQIQEWFKEESRADEGKLGSSVKHSQREMGSWWRNC